MTQRIVVHFADGKQGELDPVLVDGVPTFPDWIVVKPAPEGEAVLGKLFLVPGDAGPEVGARTFKRRHDPARLVGAGAQAHEVPYERVHYDEAMRPPRPSSPPPSPPPASPRGGRRGR